MLCKFRNNQLKSHFFYKIPNIKKHVTFFENLIADLKSSRKNASETVFILTRSFHKYFNIGKLHCGPLSKTKQFQKEVLKFFVSLWRYMVFQFSIKLACLFDQIYPVLANVERGSRSRFWDHSQLFRTNGVCIIEPNRPIFFKMLYISTYV